MLFLSLLLFFFLSLPLDLVIGLEMLLCVLAPPHPPPSLSACVPISPYTVFGACMVTSKHFFYFVLPPRIRFHHWNAAVRLLSGKRQFPLLYYVVYASPLPFLPLLWRLSSPVVASFPLEAFCFTLLRRTVTLCSRFPFLRVPGNHGDFGIYFRIFCFF